MKIFFEYCWDNLPHRSDVSNKPLGKENLSIFWHHVFEKSSHPELKYSLNNILTVRADEHFNLNNNLEYYEIAKERRKFVEDNYEKFVEESKKWEEEYEKQLLYTEYKVPKKL